MKEMEMIKRTVLSALPALGILLIFALSARAENYTVTGDMSSRIHYELQHSITVGDDIKQLMLSFVLPQNFQSSTYRQEVRNADLAFAPEPQEKKRHKDSRGNDIIVATWNSAPPLITARLTFQATNSTRLQKQETRSPFPLPPPPIEIAPYLKATAQIQSESSEIRNLSLELTRNVKTEFDAVQRVMSWVVDHVRYVNPPPRYDALFTLESGRGNCQNFSHLSAALLRAVGIPVRIVNGVTLNQPFDIALQKGTLTFKMGQGRHSWIEIWFPDQGWIPYDPQNTQLFVSNRFVRIEVGVDNNETKNDGLLRWFRGRNATVSPKLQETIGASLSSDSVAVRGSRQSYGPRTILLTPEVRAEFKPVEIKPSPPPPVIPEEKKKELRYDVPFLFGNLEFPGNVDFAFPRETMAAGKNAFEMTRNFLVETAEYVTTQVTQYAQVFVLNKPVRLERVGLALHRFGGDGWLWVDIHEDKDGKPGRLISASAIVNAEDLSLNPGYRWADFSFSVSQPVLMPGRYWIALGFTGSPIVNWFFTYGKPVGPVDGTRYKGIFQEDWSGALNYEFNYRIGGLTSNQET